MRARSPCFLAIVLVLSFCDFPQEVHLLKSGWNKTTRCEPVVQELDGKTIWWGNYSSPMMLFASKPVCLNANFEIARRFCLKCWYAEPSCARLQEAITPCPLNFSYSEEFKICYALALNQTYPPKCPYPNVMSFYDYKVLIERGFVEAPVWFPAEILAEYGVGTMVITEPSRHYGSALSASYYWRNSYGKHCLIYTSSWSFEAVYCNSSYNAICAYYPLKNTKLNYCSMNQTQPCITSDFDLSSAKCFCVRKGYCKDLAELKLPLQNFISTQGETCRIGLEKQGGKYMWVKSQKEITYSNWSIETNFHNTFGAIRPGLGWTLEREANLSCAICEEEIQFHTSSLYLKSDPVNKELILEVINMQDLVMTSEQEYPVFCFTDTPTSSQVRRFSENYFVSYSKLSSKKALLRYKYSRNCPGHYWCEAFQYPNFNIIKTHKILILDDELYGNEFAMNLLVQYTTFDSPHALFNSITVSVSDRFEKIGKGELPFYLRWMSTVFANDLDKTIEYLIHVTSKTFNSVQDEHKEFTEILSHALAGMPSVLSMTELLSVQFCLPSSTISAGGIVLHWPLTKINATIIPCELCLQDDGFPVTRSCFGDFLTGARWTSVNGSCSQNPITSPATEALYHLLNSNGSLQAVFENLTRITEYSSMFLTIDVHLIARILDAMDKKYATDLTQIATTINNMLNARRRSLQLSQVLLNSTDKILYNFDVMLQGFYKDRHPRALSFTEVENENLILLIFDALSTNIRGIGLYLNNSQKGEVRFLERGVTYKDLARSDGLEVATYIPEELVSQVNDTLPDGEPLMVIMYIFMNDYLFNEDGSADLRSANSKIFGVLLPPINDEYITSIPTIFKPMSTKFPRKCAFWNYGTSDELGSFRGHWEENDAPLGLNFTKLELCQFPHTTHFALLILGDLTQPEQDVLSDNQTVLYIITTVGCSLSILGIFIILLTFFLFKRWRENSGNQILVQFGLVTVLQICLLYTSSQVGNAINKSWCVLIGGLLHFAVLSQFCWMLVMAVLQYKRFVLVFSTPTKWVLLKSCLIGYVSPLITVLIHVTYFNDNYILGQTGMCYPAGNGLYFGVLLPGGIIIMANLVIFCVIIWNIFYRKLDCDYSYEYALTLRFRLVFVLFFMLGITWIFGFLSELTHSMAFVYMFCSTASLQGFIMFLAFIVCNENTRKMYVYLMKTIKYKLNC